MLLLLHSEDYKTGFGGQFGVQKDRVDASAAGWDHVEKLPKHPSQQDYKTGFGGEFGVQTDRVDKNAVGWEHNEKLEQHESQSKKSDYQGGQLAGAGGHGEQGPVGTNYVKARPDIPSRNTTNFKDRFEAMAKHSEEAARKKAAEEKKRREAKDKRDKEESSKVEEKRAKDIDAENRRTRGTRRSLPRWRRSEPRTSTR